MTGSIQSVRLPAWWDPEHVFHALYRDRDYAVWLDAGPGATAGHSYLGAATEQSRFVTASVPAGTVTVSRPADAAAPQTRPGTIFEFLQGDLDEAGAASVGGGEAEGFRLGWVGWFGYELGAQTTGAPAHASRLPDAALVELHRAIDFDHAARTVTLLALGGAAADSIETWAAEVEEALRASSPPAPPEPAPTTTGAVWRHSAQHYGELIQRCQESIRAGDAYQLCLTNEIRVAVGPHPVEAYRRLRAHSPSHHGGLLRFGDTALLSASPEQFLRVRRTGEVTTKPIKGTRPRSGDAATDLALRLELESSEKERAENLMIVDLMRNDLGRIARLGSVRVSSLLDVESYPHVHQLVSTIDARLLPGVTGVDALTACFPAGSMTGAPKISAIGILDRLEDGPRGVYAGAFGYLGRDGAVDLAIVIRSIVLDSAGASIGTGGGITALSDPFEEIEETRLKAAALLSALGVAAPTDTAGVAGG